MSLSDTHLRKAILELVPADGSTMGNGKLYEKLSDRLGKVAEQDFWRVRETLIQEGLLGKGKGRGGSVFRTEAAAPKAGASDRPDLDLQLLEQPANEPPTRKNKVASRGAKRKKKGAQAQVLSYRYDEKRKNNPHVGMVDTASDGVEEKATWRYDPHFDPELQFDSSTIRTQVESLVDEALASGDQEQMRTALEELKRLQLPYLQWSGKAERTSFEVDTISLHVHERIDSATILATVQKQAKADKADNAAFQPDMFHAPFENLPLREAIDFYKHERDWANRLIAGDSLLVMNSMLQKEGMEGQLQMIYIDPPYGIKYGSNFQPFTNKRDVKDRKDEDLTQEPEMIKAFRDTWELGIHSYLTYLRDRLFIARKLLRSSGSIFVQISDENVHHVRELLDEIFGVENFVSQIIVQKTESQTSDELSSVADYIIWYAKDIDCIKYNQLFLEKAVGGVGATGYVHLANKVGDHVRNLERDEKKKQDLIPDDLFLFDGTPLVSESGGENGQFEVAYRGEIFTPKSNYWKTGKEGFSKIIRANRLVKLGNRIEYKRFFKDFPVFPLSSLWTGLGERGFVGSRIYVVQTAVKAIERCLLMTTEPGDLVLDPTCGSGTTAYAAEKFGRRWITCDTSRVAIALAKKRLMTAAFEYYELKYPQEGLRGGFIYKSVPHITLKSIANNSEVDGIYEQYHPKVEESLAELNKSLKGEAVTFTIEEGSRKGEKVDFSSIDDKSATLPSGERAKANELLEWEVPIVFPENWPERSKQFFDAFHGARQTMQCLIDETIANHASQELLYDQPEVSRDKLRITGPFTVEAVPFATVLGLSEAEHPGEADMAVARSGATSRHAQWRDELLKAGIRGKGGQSLKLTDLETLPEMKYLHAVGTVANTGERVAISFGPEYAALEQRQVEIAKQEASDLFPVPKLLVFCAFTFDPEAAKDIDSIRGIQALKVQMNTDLLTEDLKKSARSNESFWLMGQPDIQVHEVEGGRLQVEVHGFDYFDTKTGELKSGGKRDIAMWELDTDYDDRSLYPRQVFFPMAGKKDGWYKLKRDIRAELNEDLLDKFHGTLSLPFEPGDNRCLAVKIVDNRGIESLKVIRLD
ncbi:MAG: site-specific DNA-methyltransferase [Alcanivorax sp.]